MKSFADTFFFHIFVIIAECYMSESTNIYPNAEVRVSKAQYSTLHIKHMVEDRGELVINPDFQRHHVWKPKQKIELVESILMGIPIPAIYLFETKDGKKQVVDGQQRISSILEFLNNGFSLKGLKILSEFDGKYFCDLDTKMQGVFEDFQLYFYIIQPPTPERVKYDIFDRVNRGGTSLTSQEMRNALYRGHATELLEFLSSSPEFIRATGGSVQSKRMKDQNMVLRAIAFDLYYRHHRNLKDSNGEEILYRSDMDDFLAKIMVFLNERASEELLDYCRESFLKSMSFIHSILGMDAFRFASRSSRRRPFNMPLFDMLEYIFVFPGISDQAERAKRVIDDFKLTYSRSDHFLNNVDSAANVDWRYNAAEELICQIIND